MNRQTFLDLAMTCVYVATKQTRLIRNITTRASLKFLIFRGRPFSDRWFQCGHLPEMHEVFQSRKENQANTKTSTHIVKLTPEIQTWGTFGGKARAVTFNAISLLI